MSYDVSFKTSSALEKMISDQINMEYGAAYQYNAFAWWFTSQEFEGMAKWMFKQAEEELEHAKKLLQFAEDREISYSFDGLAKLPFSPKSILEVFEASFEQEKEVSKSFHKMYQQALKDEDFAAKKLFNWFIEEQVEEEASFKNLIKKLIFINNDPAAILALDKELGER